MRCVDPPNDPQRKPAFCVISLTNVNVPLFNSNTFNAPVPFERTPIETNLADLGTHLVSSIGNVTVCSICTKACGPFDTISGGTIISFYSCAVLYATLCLQCMNDMRRRRRRRNLCWRVYFYVNI